MKFEQIAVQLYTLRDFLKTPPEIRSTLKKVKEIGYNAVELAGLGSIQIDELVNILNGEGLICCSTHENPASILDQPEIVIEKLSKLNCKYTSFPHPGATPVNTLQDVLSLAKRLNHLGQIFHSAGITLTYHNHHLEFRRFNGRTMLEIIFAETEPQYLQAELDTYWTQFGGGNPSAWCQRLKDRLPLMHLKDYVLNESNTPTFAEVGYGNLDWHSIIPTAEASGCKWFIIEQDTCTDSPFESIKLSLAYLKQNLCD